MGALLRLLIIGTEVGGFFALSSEDGSIYFEWFPADLTTFSTGGPTVGPDGGIYVSSNQAFSPTEMSPAGITRAFKIGDADPLKWELETKLEQTQVPLVVPKELVGGKGGDLVVVGLGHQLSATDWDNQILQAQKKFDARLIAIDSETGKERWCFHVPSSTSVYPAGATDVDCIAPDCWGGAIVDKNGTIFVPYQLGIVYAISAKNGTVLSQYYLGSLANGALSLAPGMLVVQAFDRTVCFRDPHIEQAWQEANSDDPRTKFAIPSLRGPDVSEDTPYPVPTANRKYPDLPPIAAPKRKDVKNVESEKGSLWVVVGGGDKGGIVVRKAESLKSAELGRLATAAKVTEVEKTDSRLHYQKVSGDGPDFGWVSLSLKGTPLVELE